MQIFNYNIDLGSMASAVNPANWSPDARKTAVKVGSTAIVAYVALTALEMLPTTLAATTKYIYNCDLNAQLNAAAAYSKVFFDTWDSKKADAAFTYMLEVGAKVDKYVSGASWAVKLCQTAADALPYKY